MSQVLFGVEARCVPPPAFGRRTEDGLECIAVAPCERALQFAKQFAVGSEFGGERVAVGETHVAPHARTRGGDTGEIAESCAGLAELAVRVGLPRDLGNE